jgi:hypothetical protein
MDEPLLSRKFIYAVLVVIFGFSLTVTGFVSAEAFFNFAEIIGASYILGNVASKFAPEAKG